MYGTDPRGFRRFAPAALLACITCGASFYALYDGLYNNLYLSSAMATMAGLSILVFLLPARSAKACETTVQKYGSDRGTVHNEPAPVKPGLACRIAALAWCVLILGGLYLYTVNFSEGFSSDAMLTAGLCGIIFVMAGRAEAILPGLFSQGPPRG